MSWFVWSSTKGMICDRNQQVLHEKGWWIDEGELADPLKGKLLLNLVFHRKVWITLYDVLQYQKVDARWVPCMLVRNESFKSLNLPAILIPDSELQTLSAIAVTSCDIMSHLHCTVNAMKHGLIIMTQKWNISLWI